MCDEERVYAELGRLEEWLADNRREIDQHNVAVFQRIHEMRTELDNHARRQELRIVKMIIGMWCSVLVLMGIAGVFWTNADDLQRQITSHEGTVQQKVRYLSNDNERLFQVVAEIKEQTELNKMGVDYIMRIRGIELEDVGKWKIQMDQRR